jgi:hypothetical protein
MEYFLERLEVSKMCLEKNSFNSQSKSRNANKVMQKNGLTSILSNQEYHDKGLNVNKQKSQKNAPNL